MTLHHREMDGPVRVRDDQWIPGLYDVHPRRRCQALVPGVGSDIRTIDSGDFDHVTALGDDFGIRVVTLREDYDEVHADIEHDSAVLRGVLGVRLEA